MHELKCLVKCLKTKKLQAMKNKKKIYSSKELPGYPHYVAQIHTASLLRFHIEYVCRSFRMRNICIIVDTGRTSSIIVNK